MKYGKDPNLRTPKRTWNLTLSSQERELVNHLSDLILPMPAEFPQPSQNDIVSFFDEWISAPYPDQQLDRQVLVKGFQLIEAVSTDNFSTSFCNLKQEQKRFVVDTLLVPNESNNDGLSFFLRFRYLLIGGYYTSDKGFEAIGYIGNTPLQDFPGSSAEARKMITTELKNLGLPH